VQSDENKIGKEKNHLLDQCNNTCNRFAVIGKNDSGITAGAVTFDIPVGNPNVIDILYFIVIFDAVLKPGGVHSCAYDNVKNKYIYIYIYIYIRLMVQTPENYELYINPLKSWCFFLGFKNDTEVFISFNDTTSTYPININSISACFNFTSIAHCGIVWIIVTLDISELGCTNFPES
jgi:hypothetical protein